MANNVKDASSESDTAEKSSPLTFSELPEDVLENVVGWLSLADCLALRKVSRDLRRFVNSSKVDCQTLELWFKDNWGRMDLDNLEVTIRETDDGGCMITSKRLDTEKTKTYRDEQNFKQAMIADVAAFLEMPKLEIDRIWFINNESAMWPEFLQFLKTLKFPLNVRSIRSDDLECYHSIQEYLNPEKLEEIFHSGFKSLNEFNGFAKTNPEILKNPNLKFNEMVFDDYSEESSANFSEILKSINSQLNIRSIVVEDGRWIPIICQFLNPEKVEDVLTASPTADQFNEIARMEQWKTKTRMHCRTLPEGIGLEEFVDFKEIRCKGFELTEKNLIIVRDILLKSPFSLDLLLQSNHIVNNCEDETNEMNENVNKIMSRNPAYNVATRRFSIPNSRDYFQLNLRAYRNMVLIIKRVSPE